MSVTGLPRSMTTPKAGLGQPRCGAALGTWARTRARRSEKLPCNERGIVGRGRCRPSAPASPRASGLRSLDSWMYALAASKSGCNWRKVAAREAASLGGFEQDGYRLYVGLNAGHDVMKDTSGTVRPLRCSVLRCRLASASVACAC